MGKQDITKKPDGVIECEMIIGNNLCFIQVVPTEQTDLLTVRKTLEEKISQKNFYLTRNDFYRFCREINGKEEFKGMTIINPKEEDFNIVINVSNELKTSIMPMNEDALEEMIYSKKKLGESFINKPYFVYYSI